MPETLAQKSKGMFRRNAGELNVLLRAAGKPQNSKAGEAHGKQHQRAWLWNLRHSEFVFGAGGVCEFKDSWHIQRGISYGVVIQLRASQRITRKSEAAYIAHHSGIQFQEGYVLVGAKNPTSAHRVHSKGLAYQ